MQRTTCSGQHATDNVQRAVPGFRVPARRATCRWQCARGRRTQSRPLQKGATLQHARGRALARNANRSMQRATKKRATCGGATSVRCNSAAFTGKAATNGHRVLPIAKFGVGRALTLTTAYLGWRSHGAATTCRCRSRLPAIATSRRDSPLIAHGPGVHHVARSHGSALVFAESTDYGPRCPFAPCVLLGSSMRNVARCVPHRTMPTDGARGGHRAI